MPSKRKVKQRSVHRLYYRVMILPITNRRLEAQGNYQAMEQNVLSSKHLDDNGAIFQASLALKNKYAIEHNGLVNIERRRILKRRKIGWR